MMDDSIELLDGILARVPEPADAASQSLMDELEKAKTTVSVKFDKLDTNYGIQTVSDELAEDKEEPPPWHKGLKNEKMHRKNTETTITH